MQLIDVYASTMEADIAVERRAALEKAGLDTIAFAWAGDTERGRKHYSRIQGPTFLVEYDNTQNDGNHVHSVWRDFGGDFGRDLLREHLQQVAPCANGAIVAFEASASDTVAGVVPVTCAPVSDSTFALGQTTVLCSAADSFNNTGSASFIITVVDTTPPSVTCGSADGFWHAENVALACAATDSASGLANASDASFALSTSVPADVETANAQTGRRAVCDAAGNCADAGPIGGNRIDRKGPAITITAPAANTYAQNAPGAASCTCADGGSGLATCAGPVASGDSIDTSAVGTFTFEARAVDAGEPGRGRDQMSVTVRDRAGEVVASMTGALSGGNIQSLRLIRIEQEREKEKKREKR